MLYLKLVNHDHMFQSLRYAPIIANDFDTSTKEGREKLSRLLYTRYEGDTLSVIPTCDCGNLYGGINLGKRCHICGVVCDSVIERPLESTLWLRKLPGVKAFINPTAWTILSEKLKTASVNVLEWLCNPHMVLEKEPILVKKLKRNGFDNKECRGINYFYDHFDEIMEFIFCEGFTLTTYEAAAKAGHVEGKNVEIVQFIRENRGSIFSEYLPMPSKAGFIVESNESGVYADSIIKIAFDALMTVTSIKNSLEDLPVSRLEARTVKVISNFARFYRAFAEETLSQKSGILRKHVFGIRLHFTARAVITSISTNHNYQDLHIPWNVAVQLFSIHITNKLYRMGYTPREVERHLREYSLRYCPILDNILNELITETPYTGIPCLLQRNPSLARGSAQQLFITKVKTDHDPETKICTDNTFSLSVLILVGYNADFDGDELNLLLINDHEMYMGAAKLAPHYSTLDVTEPRKLSANLKMPVPVSSTINEFFYHESLGLPPLSELNK